VVCASAGNHAQGVALAAAMQGVEATVFMPVEAPLPKVQATEAYGADVRLVGESFDDTLQEALAFAEDDAAACSSIPSTTPTSSPGRARSGSSCSSRYPTSAPSWCRSAAAG
jgi:cysteine synthase